jgi:beta-lactamase superfamily II metal-dependent hydrolase
MMRNILVAAVASTALLASPASAAEATLKVAPIDMEGGGATLFVTPEGRSLLIDTGTPSFVELKSGEQELDGAKNGAERIKALAKTFGVTKIDYLIITHYHGDHVGGIFNLLDIMPVGTIIDHGPNREVTPADGSPGGRAAGKIPGTVNNYARYLEAIQGHKHIVAKPGDVFKISSLTDTIVASDGQPIATPLPGAGGPGQFCDTPPVAENGGVENEKSVASILSFGKVKIALFGDLTWNREHDLACPIDKVGKVNVLIVTHHGMNLSSNPSSIAALRPDIAVMGNGPTHGGAPETIKTISASPGLQGFWRMHGAVLNPELDGDTNFIANPKAPPDHGYTIRLDITKAGAITVTNTRNGFAKTYQVK